MKLFGPLQARVLAGHATAGPAQRLHELAIYLYRSVRDKQQGATAPSARRCFQGRDLEGDKAKAGHGGTRGRSKASAIPRARSTRSRSRCSRWSRASCPRSSTACGRWTSSARSRSPARTDSRAHDPGGATPLAGKPSTLIAEAACRWCSKARCVQLERDPSTAGDRYLRGRRSSPTRRSAFVVTPRTRPRSRSGTKPTTSWAWG